jgi:hypothetical protein
MSNDSPALSGIDAGSPRDAEYDAVYAAVTATERGRWFLTEFTRRNRHGDTDSLIAAIARAEAAVRGGASANGSTARRDLGGVAERIADIAFGLRERGANAALCDALDATVREICDVCVGDAQHRNGENGKASPDQSWALSAVQAIPEPARQVADSASDADQRLSFEDLDRPLENGDRIAEAAAMPAVSSGKPTDEAADERPSTDTPTVLALQDGEAISAPVSAEIADHAPRWQIDAPDFIFRPSKHGTNGANRPVAEFSGDLGQGHALLPRPHLLPRADDNPTMSFEPAPQRVAVMPDSKADIPSARGSAVATVRPAPRQVSVSPLAALRAMTDEELIALFG